jgi:hypothetical protein
MCVGGLEHSLLKVVISIDTGWRRALKPKRKVNKELEESDRG